MNVTIFQDLHHAFSKKACFSRRHPLALQLRAILAANDWRFTRDNVDKAKVFDKITSRWNDITEDFQNRGFQKRSGYIHHDGIRYIVLPHARKLFAAYSPTLSRHLLSSPNDPDDDPHDEPAFFN